MADQLQAVVAALQALPLAAQVAVAVGSTLVLAVCLRLLKHTVLRGSAPPVEEGIPFIGGLLKFAKVRGSRWRPAGWPPRCRRRRRRLGSVAALACKCCRPCGPSALPWARPKPSGWLRRRLPSPGPPAAYGGDVQEARRGVHHPPGPQEHDLCHRPPRLPPLLQCH